MTKHRASCVLLALSFFACRVQFIHGANECRDINEDASVRKVECGGLTGFSSSSHLRKPVENFGKVFASLPRMCAEMPLPGSTIDNVYTLVCIFDTLLPLFSFTIIAVAQRGSIPLASIFLPWLHTEHQSRLKRNLSNQRKETSQIRKVVPCQWYSRIPAHGRPASTTSGRKRH